VTVTAGEVREGDYGTKVVAVEPGGAEFIPPQERHGRPLNLLWAERGHRRDRLVRRQQRQRDAGPVRADRDARAALPGGRRAGAGGIAFFGHNLVHVFEQWALPLLAAAFLLATIFTFTAATPGAVAGNTGGVGGFLLTVGAAFGYAAGWNPYATDYTRYLPTTANAKRAGLFAGLGVFVRVLGRDVWYLRRRQDEAALSGLLFDRTHNPWSGFAAMLIAMVVPIVLFCAQALYTGSVAAAFPGIGDLTFEVGFVLAAVLYALFSAKARRQLV
jgi:hypothetical protein